MRKRVGIPLLLLLLASLSLVWAVVVPTPQSTSLLLETKAEPTASKEQQRQGRRPSFHRATHSTFFSNELGINRRRRSQFQARNAHVTPPRVIKPVALLMAADYGPRAVRWIGRHLERTSVHAMASLTVLSSSMSVMMTMVAMANKTP